MKKASEDMSNDESRVTRPPLFWLITETGRALFEFSTFYPYKILSNPEKTGDGHPVMTLPGFMATDASTAPMRSYLDKLGYSSYGWGIGRNKAREAYFDILHRRLKSIYATHEKKVSLIGWSLGGVYARQIAKELPHLVRQVIVLGSPFKGLTAPNHARWVYDLITTGKPTHEVNQILLKDIPRPAPVPTTSIYTKEDGIVPWEVCLEEEDEIHQNVRVRGSHIGLGVNPAVMNIISDRLAQDVTEWKPFQPSGVFDNLFAYPD